MKIRNLDINSYRHLHDIKFDFTYPEKHLNKGKPLNKICIIGQSASGKTSILELIKDSLIKLDEADVVNGKYIFNHFSVPFKGILKYVHNDSLLQITEDAIIKNGKEFRNMPASGGGAVQKLMGDGIKLLYLSSELITRTVINILKQNPLDILSNLPEGAATSVQKLRNGQNYIYEFGKETDQQIWLSLLFRILDYRKRFTQMVSELIHKGAIADFNRLNNDYLKWAETNENPLISFAKYFNPILNKLCLEVDLINTEYPIPIKSMSNDEIISISELSTGTKGLLFSMFPLYEVDTTESIILIDEPERSLFPDMQIDLITYYQNLAPDAQFIVATHSPFVAAAFEPEERFILYFNKEGHVSVRRGESPIGDDPNDILRNDFNVDYYNDFGKRAYQKYRDLKIKAAQETEPERKKELIIKLAELGDKYNF